MSGKSFLRVFQTIGHAVEAAAMIVAPVIKVVDPVIGNLMTMAVNAAVGMEAAVTAPAAGGQRADLVGQQTQAVVNVINGILLAEGKSALPSNITDVVGTQVKAVVSGLNTVADTVDQQKTAAAAA
jgi:hypothetical protein